MRKYEAMFLFDPAVAGDWEATEAEVQRLMERAEARLVACAKWDEGRLAYEVKKRKRGLYVLTFFEADPSKIAGLEHDVRLSEPVLRVLVLRADHLTEDEMKEAVAKPASAYSDEESGGGGRFRYGRREDGPTTRREPVSGKPTAPAEGTPGTEKPTPSPAVATAISVTATPATEPSDAEASPESEPTEGDAAVTLPEPPPVDTAAPEAAKE